MKIVWWIISSIVVITILVVAVMMAPSNVKNSKEELVTSTNTTTTEPSSNVTSIDGRYVDYNADFIGDTSYNTTILFFYAPWCPECRGFDQAILAGDIPANTQILKLDYDSSQELRKQYGVTIQTTFVRVDKNGNKLGLWSGYGEDKSIEAIIENTK